jgi:hypothetical protein
MWKRIAQVFFLILVLFMPYLSTQIGARSKLYRIKKQVKWRLIQGMPSHALVTLNLSKEQAAQALQWKHSKEFKYQGTFYDVVSCTVQGDRITYVLWPDSEETHLQKSLLAFSHAALQQLPQSKNQAKHLLVFWQLLFVEYINLELKPIFIWLASNKIFFDSREIMGISRQLFSPPEV